MIKVQSVIIFGPPGCGKGTQSQFMVKYFKLNHLSTGDILRGEISHNTPLGKEAKHFIDNGKLVTDDLVNRMMEKKIHDSLNDNKGILFDGYPRTLEQATFVDEVLQKKGYMMNALISINVQEEELIKRILIRGKTSGRSDDTNVETIKKRLVEYEAKTLPIKQYYSSKKIVHEINGQVSIEEVFDAIKKVLSQ